MPCLAVPNPCFVALSTIRAFDRREHWPLSMSQSHEFVLSSAKPRGERPDCSCQLQKPLQRDLPRHFVPASRSRRRCISASTLRSQFFCPAAPAFENSVIIQTRVPVSPFGRRKTF